MVGSSAETLASRRVMLRLCLMAFVAVAAVAILAPHAEAGAIISTGVVQMGIQDAGDLTQGGGTASANCSVRPTSGDTTLVSLRWVATNDEAMDCDFEGEGWGVAYENGGPGAGCTYVPDTAPPTPTGADCVIGQAYYYSGGAIVQNLVLTSFTATGTSAISVTKMGVLQITQNFHVAKDTTGAVMNQAFADDISIKNLGTTQVNNLQFRRVMNFGSAKNGVDCTWGSFAHMPDPSSPGNFLPTPSALWRTNMYAYGNANPTLIVAGGSAYGPGLDTAVNPQDLFNVGPADQGGVWDLHFGDLKPGKYRNFTMYYGGDVTKDLVMGDLAKLGVSVYDLSISLLDLTNTGGVACTNVNSEPGDGSPVTFFMAFGNITKEQPPEPGQPFPPVAAVTTYPPNECLDAKIRLRNLSYAGKDQTLVSYAWDFGDGTTSTEKDPAPKEYLTDGYYTVKLTVTDDIGQTASTTRKVHYIGNIDCPPDLNPNPDRIVYLGQSITVCWIGSDPDDPPESLRWRADNLPDGMEWDEEQHCMSWMPNEGQLGEWSGLRVSICDDHNCAWREVRIEVYRPPNPKILEDNDKDGVTDDKDNCPSVSNKDQADTDGDKIGDLCDTLPCKPGGEVSNVAISKPVECSAANEAPPSAARPNDRDGDDVLDTADNCPLTANRDQADMDHDLIGDACDLDLDGDEVIDVAPASDPKAIADNCPTVSNPDQRNTNGGLHGDACASLGEMANACPLCATSTRPASTSGTTATATTTNRSGAWMIVAASAGAVLVIGGVAVLMMRRRGAP